MSSAPPVSLIHPQVREAVMAAFEEREGWRAKIAAAVRQLPEEGAELASERMDKGSLRKLAVAHVQAAMEHLAQALVINQALMGVLGAEFEAMPESHEKHCKEIGAAIETLPELELQDTLEETLEALRSAEKNFTE